MWYFYFGQNQKKSRANNEANDIDEDDDDDDDNQDENDNDNDNEIKDISIEMLQNTSIIDKRMHKFQLTAQIFWQSKIGSETSRKG